MKLVREGVRVRIFRFIDLRLTVTELVSERFFFLFFFLGRERKNFLLWGLAGKTVRISEFGGVTVSRANSPILFSVQEII